MPDIKNLGLDGVHVVYHSIHGGGVGGGGGAGAGGGGGAGRGPCVMALCLPGMTIVTR